MKKQPWYIKLRNRIIRFIFRLPQDGSEDGSVG